MERTKIENKLLELGVPAGLQGFLYLTQAIERYHPGMYVTKDLYPVIATTYEIPAGRIERCMRHAIETARDRGDLDMWGACFGNSISRNTGRPTNTEFIAAVRLRLEQEAQRDE